MIKKDMNIVYLIGEACSKIAKKKLGETTLPEPFLWNCEMCSSASYQTLIMSLRGICIIDADVISF